MAVKGCDPPRRRFWPQFGPHYWWAVGNRIHNSFLTHFPPALTFLAIHSLPSHTYLRLIPHSSSLPYSDREITTLLFLTQSQSVHCLSLPVEPVRATLPLLRRQTLATNRLGVSNHVQTLCPPESTVVLPPPWTPCSDNPRPCALS